MSHCRIAIAGLGVVGAQTAALLLSKDEQLTTATGKVLTLTAVSARSRGKDRGFDMSN